ncbi:MAG: hypothetical protein M1830_010815 [Pleopsidium flavum]|nr:MAG: hypothetical protein M1830_010815 [Pleopsidium flavum]
MLHHQIGARQASKVESVASKRDKTKSAPELGARGNTDVTQRFVSDHRVWGEASLLRPRTKLTHVRLKPDENAPERPPSAYVLFSNKIREGLKDHHLSFTDIAKRVGERWQALSPDEKGPFETQAAAAKEKYNTELARYKTTESYKENVRYLAEFKAKNTGIEAEGKRPRLETEHSTTSSTSTSSLLNTSVSSTGPSRLGRGRVPSTESTNTRSSVSGQPSPAENVGSATQPMGVGAALHLLRTPSNSPASPTSTLGYKDPPISSSLQLAPQGAASIEEGREWNLQHSPRGQSLPRILPVEGSEKKCLGGLPAAVTEAVLERRRNSPKTNARRSNRAPPAPLLHKDTSRSSMSSSLSFGSTLSSATYTPITPADDPRALRSLPGLSSSIFTATGKQSYFDQPPKPIHPPLPGNSPPLYTGFQPRQAQSRVNISSGMNWMLSIWLYYTTATIFVLR